jgi:uroporphyrinogen decarboxylase
MPSPSDGQPFLGLRGAFWCHFPPELRYGRGTVPAHLLWRRLTGGGFIKVMNEYGHPLPRQIRDAAGLRRIAAAPAAEGAYRDQLALVRRIVDRTSGRYPVFATVVNPFGQLRGALGEAPLAALIAADAAAVGAALLAIAEGLGRLARDCVRQAGADGIFFASQGGEADRFDDPAFEAMIGRPDRGVLAAAGEASPHNILHVCGAAVALHRYRDYPAAAVNWDAARNRPLEGAPPGEGWPGEAPGMAPLDGIWRQACLMPGLDLRGALLHGDAAAIRAETRRLHAGRAGPPPVLAAACSVPSDLAFWRMRTALAEAHGGAPDGPRPRLRDLAAWHGLRAAARLRRRAQRLRAVIAGRAARLAAQSPDRH